MIFLKQEKKGRELSSFDLLMLANELNILAGGRMQKIFQKGKQLRFEIFVSGSGTKELFFEPGKLFLTNYKREASNERFSQYLRKHLSGQKIVSIRQIGLERIVEIETEGNILALEMFSKGNVIFCDKTRMILMPMEIQEWKSRKIAQGQIYKYPPPVKNPFVLDISEFQDTMQRSEKGLAAFLATETNLSGKYAEEVCTRAGIDKAKKCKDISNDEARKLFDAIQSLPNEPKPNIILENNKPANFAPIEMQIYGGREKKYFPAFMEALDEFFANMEKEAGRMEVSENEGKHLRIIETQKSALEKWSAAEKENSMKGKAVEGSISPVQEIIDMINGLRAGEKSWDEIKSEIVERKAGNIPVSEIREKEGIAIIESNIQIDFRRSARENAKNYFEKAKHARRKKEAAAKALERAEAEMGEVTKEKPKEKIQMKRRKGQKWFEKFRWFFTKDNFLVVGGRDATQNEMIFKKHIEKGDIVLHADVHGAPLTVIKAEGRKISEDAIKEAAEFAAAYSSAWKRRLGSADVYWITPEQVSKKPPAGTSLAKGAFMIYGKKNYVRNIGLKIAVGVAFEQDDKGNKLAYPACGTARNISAHAKYFAEIVPGEKQHAELIKKIKAILMAKARPDDRPLIESIPLEDLDRLLPAGGGEIVG